MTAPIPGLAGGVGFGRDSGFDRATTPYGYPLYATHRAPDPHYAEQEAAIGAENKKWVDGTPEYRAAITADLRREDIVRIASELARAPDDEMRGHVRRRLARAHDELAAAEAVLGGAVQRRAA